MSSQYTSDSTTLPPARPKRFRLWKLVVDQYGITENVLQHNYEGLGTKEDPFMISWIIHDPRNPMEWSTMLRWAITITAACATLAVTLVSSAYTGGSADIRAEFDISSEVVTLGVSLFVLGFAIGPVVWAPLSEVFGRQVLFVITYAAFMIFNAGCAGAQNIETLIVMRFFAGAFGSSPLTNAGGTIADMFPASHRGLAIATFSLAPFLGPALGPVIGGFLGTAAGWRWVMGFLALFSGILWIAGMLIIPETYAPVLLRRRARKMSQMTGKVYVSKLDHDQENGPASLGALFKKALSRPWVLLFTEPIVLLLAIYLSVIYGTLYMFFSAFPIVYQQQRGWNPGEGGLAFLGIVVGMLVAFGYIIQDNKRYVRVQQQNGGRAPPEARLPPCLVGSVALPVGLFWFAWTCQSSVHYLISIAAGVPFGFGMVLVFLASMNYLIDSYTIFAASVLAGSAVMRSLCGAAFPLFTRYMYEDLGVNWATSIPAFASLACVPFPFLFYKYGVAIRMRCKFAADSAAFMEKMYQGSDRGISGSSSAGEEGQRGPGAVQEGQPATEPEQTEKAPV